MRLHCGQKCSSTGAPAPQLRHSSIEGERRGIGSGVMSAGSGGGRLAQPAMYDCRLHAASCRLSCAEGTAATAGRLRVRVMEDEALRQKRGVVVERGPVQEQQALLVDEDPGAIRPLEYLVAESRLAIPRERVTQPRAAPTLYAHTKTPITDTLLCHHSSELLCGRVRKP